MLAAFPEQIVAVQNIDQRGRRSMPEIFERTFLGNTYWELALACVVALVCVLLISAGRRIAANRYAKLAQTERIELMEVPLQVLGKTGGLFITVLALFLGLATLEVGPKLQRVAATALTIAFFWQVGIWATTGLAAYLEHKQRSALNADRAAIGSLGIIGFVGRVLVWTVVAMMVLDNLGIDVTALVAGLGVGGIAVALAVQNVLGDLLASLSITLDRPFVVGDFLIVGDYLGSVERIGIKSVRLRSLSGEQLIMSNADVLSSRVRNYGRMAERRVVFTFLVTYETSRAALKQIPDTVREIVQAQTDVRFDRSHLSKFGDFAFEFETVYYVLSADYNRYMDIPQSILFALHEALERAGVDIAIPTRRLLLETPNAGEPNA
jgi:small-conductance mechanosensitive channel